MAHNNNLIDLLYGTREHLLNNNHCTEFIGKLYLSIISSTLRPNLLTYVNSFKRVALIGSPVLQSGCCLR